MTGTNRYEVATNIAKKIITQDTDTAFIASGESFPDALSVASIAGQLQIPLLTTNSSNLSAEVKTFLANNPQINHFVISGGSVSSTVENQLKTYGTVSRISGSNRFEVAENAANAFNIIPNTITVANGMDFPDALTGGVLSALSKGPLLLATPTSTPIETLRYFEKYSLDINNFYILGGTGSVSNDTINKLYPYIQ
ncbi:cell wall-binding repeat-containing protein [Laceyella tengchongensis]|uniref:cell wall-binding repeat-containing protein n=1 Tax=Laceyella tengchongensis TaxID=574699 RepID=UPI001CB962D7|nr:cell wall-binding repeat-containing protein [Laceyella tengchongensis]